MGPKRYTEAPCHLSDIPIIDVVVISHSHYDHLSHPSILKIQETHPNVLFAVPLGLKKASVIKPVFRDKLADFQTSGSKRAVLTTLSSSTGGKTSI